MRLRCERYGYSPNYTLSHHEPNVSENLSHRSFRVAPQQWTTAIVTCNRQTDILEDFVTKSLCRTLQFGLLSFLYEHIPYLSRGFRQLARKRESFRLLKTLLIQIHPNLT